MKLFKALVFTFSIFLMSCSSSSTDNNNKNSNKEITKIDAKDLSKEINENSMSAELRYLNKRIIVTNCINGGVEKRYNYASYTAFSEEEYCVLGEVDWDNHLFFVRDDQMINTSELKNDQIIRVSGLVVEVEDGRVVMEDCRILLNENGSSIWEYDKTETSYWKMREEQKQAQLKEQLEREKAEMKMLETKAEEERKLSDDKDEVLNNISKQADENESEDAEALRLQEEYYNSQTEERLKWETEQEEKEKLEMNDSINFK